MAIANVIIILPSIALATIQFNAKIHFKVILFKSGISTLYMLIVLVTT